MHIYVNYTGEYWKEGLLVKELDNGRAIIAVVDNGRVVEFEYDVDEWTLPATNATPPKF